MRVRGLKGHDIAEGHRDNATEVRPVQDNHVSALGGSTGGSNRVDAGVAGRIDEQVVGLRVVAAVGDRADLDVRDRRVLRDRLGGDARVTPDCEVVLGTERETSLVVYESYGPDGLEQPFAADVKRRPAARDGRRAGTGHRV